MNGRWIGSGTWKWMVGVFVLAMTAIPIAPAMMSGFQSAAQHSFGAPKTAFAQSATTLQCENVPAAVRPPGTTVRVTLRRPDGSPLSGRQIDWSLPPGIFSSLLRRVSTTNDAGVASTDYLIAYDSGRSGETAVTARFAGDGEYQSTECEVRFQFDSPALPTPTPRAGACPNGQLGPTSTTCQPAWTARPPSPGTPAVCPTANAWLLLYWGGDNGIAIGSAATACGSADRYWARQGTRWLAFSAENPAASDEWTLQRGEALFVHGQ